MRLGPPAAARRASPRARGRGARGRRASAPRSPPRAPPDRAKAGAGSWAGAGAGARVRSWWSDLCLGLSLLDLDHLQREQPLEAPLRAAPPRVLAHREQAEAQQALARGPRVRTEQPLCQLRAAQREARGQSAARRGGDMGGALVCGGRGEGRPRGREGRPVHRGGLLCRTREHAGREAAAGRGLWLVRRLEQPLVEMVQALVLEGELLEPSLETRHLLDRHLRDGQFRHGRRVALPVLVRLLFPKLVAPPQ